MFCLQRRLLGKQNQTRLVYVSQHLLENLIFESLCNLVLKIFLLQLKRFNIQFTKSKIYQYLVYQIEITPISYKDYYISRPKIDVFTESFLILL